MNYKEVTRKQEKAHQAFHQFFFIDLTNEMEVLLFLRKIYPYLIDINIHMPTEQLFTVLGRYGYGVGKATTGEGKVIERIMMDVQTEVFLNSCRLKYQQTRKVEVK